MMSLMCGQVEARCSCHIGHEQAVLIPRKKTVTNEQTAVSLESEVSEQCEAALEDALKEIQAEAVEDIPSRDMSGMAVEAISPYANLFDVTTASQDTAVTSMSSASGIGYLPDNASMAARWRFHLAQVQAMLPTISRKVAGLVGGIGILAGILVARWRSNRDEHVELRREERREGAHYPPGGTLVRSVSQGGIRGSDASIEGAVTALLVNYDKLVKENREFRRRLDAVEAEHTKNAGGAEVIPGGNAVDESLRAMLEVVDALP